MISPATITAKAGRLYSKAVKAWLAGELESFFPYRMPASLNLAKDHRVAIAEVESLRQSAKETRGHGYSITWELRRSRTYGLNRFPTEIVIETMDDLVQMIDRSSQWITLQAAVNTVRSRQPKLETWLNKGANWKVLLDVADSLDGLLDIVEYFHANPRPDCFARELPLAVSTKLIEIHRRKLATWLDIVLPPYAIDPRYDYDAFEPRYGLRYARPHYLLRTLDRELQMELGLPFAELSLPAESLSKLDVRNVRVVIVENKVNLLSLPSSHRTLALGGLGSAVTQLAAVKWLHENEVIYWGDLDGEGFVILDRLREHVPNATSLLMSADILDRYSHLATTGNSGHAKELTNLSEDERRCYHQLCQANLRIEQEHIPQRHVVEALERQSVGASAPDYRA